jgi:hypothetical protein
MKQRGFGVIKGPQQDLPGAPTKQRTLLPKYLALHEAEIRTAEEQHDATPLPAPVPCLLDDRRQLWTHLTHPLKLIQGDDQLPRPLPPLLDEFKSPRSAIYLHLSQQRLPQALRCISHELAELHLMTTSA